MDWQPLNLAVKAGDGTAVLETVGRRVKSLCPKPGPGRRPVIVWLSDPTDEELTRRIEQSPLGNRNIGLALQRFRCLRVVVPDLPAGAFRERCLASLGFRFFDPAGDPVGEPVVGKRSTSPNCLARRVEATWAASYALDFKAYLKRMRSISGQREALDAQLEVVRARQERLKHRPDAEQALAVDREMARIRKERKEVAKNHAALLRECRLLPRFLPKPAKKPAEKPKTGGDSAGAGAESESALDDHKHRHGNE